MEHYDVEDLEFSESPKWIPEGVYDAICIDYSKNLIPYKGTLKLYLTFEILTEPYRGEKIKMWFDIGYDYKNISTTKKYSKYWVIANDDKPPSRNAKKSPRIFLNKVFRVIVRTCKPKVAPSIKLMNNPNIAEKELPLESWYSVIDDIRLKQPDVAKFSRNHIFLKSWKR